MMKIKNIKLKEKQNIRDFSYIINKDNYTILNNSFLRSNNINVFDREDIEFLKDNYHLKTIIDLRNKDEVFYLKVERENLFLVVQINKKLVKFLIYMKFI